MDFASPRYPVRRTKRQALSSVYNVSQAMTNVNSCKEMFHPYEILVSIITYIHVTMFGITPWSLRCKSESGMLEPQAKAMSNWLSRISPTGSP